MLVVMAITQLAPACVWHRDTVWDPMQGKHEPFDIVIGRFARYPKLYYTMRIERVESELEANPRQLALYDDISVAYDKIGDATKAIEWIERKGEVLAKLDANDPDVREHQYRYLANRGTFYAHRWMMSGANRNNVTDLQKGYDILIEAVTVKPDAHFGREMYQMMAMAWMLEPQSVKDRRKSGLLDTFLHERYVPAPLLGKEPQTKFDGTPLFADSIEGIEGLIALGTAWESVDMYTALAQSAAFGGQDHATSMKCSFAAMRILELREQGKRSVINESKLDGMSLHSLTSLSSYPYSVGSLDNDRPRGTFRFLDIDSRPRAYRIIRDGADAWHEHRMAYMTSRLERGEHPDTHPDFWLDFKPLPRPDLGPSVFQRLGTGISNFFTLKVVLFAVIPGLTLTWVIRRIV